jgi:hypothetical protein
LEQRPQHLEVKQAFSYVKNEHVGWPIERLSPNRRRVERDGERGGANPREDRAAADMIEITHQISPFEDIGRILVAGLVGLIDRCVGPIGDPAVALDQRVRVIGNPISIG